MLDVGREGKAIRGEREKELHRVSEGERERERERERRDREPGVERS